MITQLIKGIQLETHTIEVIIISKLTIIGPSDEVKYTVTVNDIVHSGLR
jgi:hypothetical protein